jgi:hypothetical protein
MLAVIKKVLRGGIAMGNRYIVILLLVGLSITSCSYDATSTYEDIRARLMENYKTGYNQGYEAARLKACNNAIESYKGLYVDNFDLILGDSLLENELLSYAFANGFTTLSLYGLQKILLPGKINNTSTETLSNFIFKAKTLYAIRCISAIGESAGFFKTVISVYNHCRPLKHQKIDAYNLEFEFWNYVAIGTEGQESYCTYYLKKSGENCDINGAYNYYIGQISELHQLAKDDSCLCETYVGYVNGQQAKEISDLVDRVMVHVYVTIPRNSYNYSYERLAFFGGAKSTVNIIPIFSSEPEFMGEWLKNHGESTVYKAYVALYRANKNHFKAHLNLIGYQWYVYSTMNKIALK